MKDIKIPTFSCLQRQHILRNHQVPTQPPLAVFMFKPLVRYPSTRRLKESTFYRKCYPYKQESKFHILCMYLMAQLKTKGTQGVQELLFLAN